MIEYSLSMYKGAYGLKQDLTDWLNGRRISGDSTSDTHKQVSEDSLSVAHETQPESELGLLRLPFVPDQEARHKAPSDMLDMPPLVNPMPGLLVAGNAGNAKKASEASSVPVLVASPQTSDATRLLKLNSEIPDGLLVTPPTPIGMNDTASSSAREAQDFITPPVPDGAEVVPMRAGQIPEADGSDDATDLENDREFGAHELSGIIGGDLVPMRTPSQLASQRAKISVLEFEADSDTEPGKPVTIMVEPEPVKHLDELNRLDGVEPSDTGSLDEPSALESSDNNAAKPDETTLAEEGVQHIDSPDTVAESNVQTFEIEVKSDEALMSQSPSESESPESTDQVSEPTVTPVAETGVPSETDAALVAPATPVEDRPPIPSFPPRMPDVTELDSETVEEYAQDRDAHFAQRLHQVILTRKARAEKLKAEEKQKNAVRNSRARAVALCLLLILSVAVAWLALRFVQHNSIVISGETLSTRAAELYQEGHYAEAADTWQSALEKSPESPSFLMGLARAAARAGRPQTASLAWDMYLNVIPEDDNDNRSQAFYERALVRSEMDDPEGAITNLYQSLRCIPANYEACFTLGKLLEKQNHYDSALQSYRGALNLRPSSDEAREALDRVQKSLQMRGASIVSQASASADADIKASADENAVKSSTVTVTDVNKHLADATKAMNHGRYDEVIALLTDLTKSPVSADVTSAAASGDAAVTDIRVWIGLAGAWMGKGNSDNARSILNDPYVISIASGDPTYETMREQLRIRPLVPDVGN